MVKDSTKNPKSMDSTLLIFSVHLSYSLFTSVWCAECTPTIPTFSNVVTFKGCTCKVTVLFNLKLKTLC